MRFLSGYVGCALIFILLMGLVLHSFVLPTINRRKKHFVEWLTILFFGLGMLRSMAVKPDGGNASQSPRRSPIRQDAEAANTMENASTTNIPPWETTLAFSHIVTTPSYVQLTAAWPMGFYNYDPLLDLLIAYPTLTNDWQWITSQAVASSATNCTFTVTPSMLGLTELPPALFACVTERQEACKTMDDPDDDGVPNSYEFYHGTNPYVPDAHRIQTLDCTNTSLSALKTALANSTDYSIINLPTGTIDAAESIDMPPHPVLLSGPKDGYAVIKSTANLGAFMFKDGQDSHTLVRNIYLDLLKCGNFQVGFWCGGNLPWSGIGAAPSFENVVVRTPRSETQYIGWLYYCNNGENPRLKNCVVNALGATNVRGTETGNGPCVDLVDCSFLNFPSNGFQTLSRTFSLGNDGTSNAVTRTEGEATIFVDLSPGVDSDGDGIPNDREFNELGTDPWLSDSDGDGIPDSDELIAETDPLDVLSFIHGVVIEVTNTTAAAGSQVYVSWERVGDSPDSGFLTNSASRSFFTSFGTPHTSGEIRVTCFRDLNGNAIFDPDHDISLTQSVPERNAYIRLLFTFGDVDHDGINDLQERRDGTDPYSSSSLKITRTVRLKNDDIFPAVTNYVAQGLTRTWNTDEPFHRLSGTSETLTFNTNAISGAVYLKCYRDFNKNGSYDEDVEPLYVYPIQNSTPPTGDTIPFSFKDRDGDSIPDSVEWAEGTNINNNRSYCYSAILTVSGIFSTTNQLYAQPFFGTNALTSAHLVSTNQEEYALEHSSTTNSERFVVKYWDDLNANHTLDDGEPFTVATVYPNGHATTLVYDLPYSNFDANKNLLPDWWEDSTGLSTNSVSYDYSTDTDNDGLINLHEYWTGCDPIKPDGSNTLFSVLSRAIDDITPISADSLNLCRFENYAVNGYRTNFIDNASFWLGAADLSSAAMWCMPNVSDSGPTNTAVTLVSPIHVIYASHYSYAMPLTKSYFFKGISGMVYERKIVSKSTISNVGNHDISIGLLDTPLPSDVSFMSVLPNDFHIWLNDLKCLPVVFLDQEEKAHIGSCSGIILSEISDFSISKFDIKNRLPFFKAAIGGDSSSPKFLLLDNKPILMGVTHFAGGAAGHFVSQHIAEINKTMHRLSPLTPYTLHELDLSGYPRLLRTK